MSTLPLHSLTESQVEQFKLNGFLVVEDVLSPDEIETLSVQTDLIAAGKAKHIPEANIQLEKDFRNAVKSVENPMQGVRKLSGLANRDSVMWRHADNPKIVNIIADLLGTNDIKLFGDQLFMKAPEGVGTQQPWHQDSASWKTTFPMDLVSAWTAIDAATEENGCLNFIPGTHRWGMVQKDQLTHFLDDFGGAEWPVVPVPLRPGSISFHHSLTLHMSKVNQSKKRRRGYAVHYMRAMSWQDKSDSSYRNHFDKASRTKRESGFRQIRGRSFPGRV